MLPLPATLAFVSMFSLLSSKFHQELPNRLMSYSECINSVSMCWPMRIRHPFNNSKIFLIYDGCQLCPYPRQGWEKSIHYRYTCTKS